MSTPQSEPGGRDNVIPLRPTETTGEPGREIERPTAVTGEVLSAQESAALDRRLPNGPVRQAGPVRLLPRTRAVVSTVVRNPTVMVVVRVTVTTLQGGRSWAVRAYDASTMGVYRRAIKAAEAAGNWDELREWTTRRESAVAQRHQRIMDLPRLAVGLVKVVLGGLAGLVVFVLVIAAVVHLSDAGTFAGVIEGVLSFVRFMVWVVTAAWTPLLVGTPLLVLWGMYREGTRRAEPPRWLVRPEPEADTMSALPDEGTIVTALANLNIPAFRKALKEGWRLRFLQPPTIDGKGYRVQVQLPPAVPVEEIVKRKHVLAHNLVRYPIEVWPTEPAPTVLDLWVARSGALSGPVDPWPLLAELDTARTDYFAAVPVGITIRGDTINARFFQANYAAGGAMGSGKTSLVLTLLAGAMLDPLVDIDVVVMAENADYDPMIPRLRSLTTGTGEDTVGTALGMLRELFDDLTVRGKALREHGSRAVTRELAEKDARLRPRILVIDECQNLFKSDSGPDAIDATVKVINTARKYGVTVVLLTPEPSDNSLPRKVMTVISNKACYAIGDQLGNDAVLGTGSYKAGISAVGLTPATDQGPGDVGTCMTRGFMPNPGLMRTYFLTVEELTRVTARAVALRENYAAPVDTTPTVDVLADTLTVLGEDRLVRDHELLQRLARLRPGIYQGWTNKELTAALGDAAPYKTKGYLHVSRNRVTDAITERDENAVPDDESA